MDAIFGFSFSGPLRAPFDIVINELKKTSKPITAVDVPSGWHVENGPPDGDDVFMPDVLVSLTAPKPCIQHFQGRHFLGGRFVSPKIAEKYHLDLPDYPGLDQVVELNMNGADGGKL